MMELMEQQFRPIEVNSTESSLFASGDNPLRRPVDTDRRLCRVGMPSTPNFYQMNFNRQYSLTGDYTEENPFSAREVYIFVGVYSLCVIFLVCMYEILMPVFNNPTYPYYNNVPDYTYKSSSRQ